MAEARSAARFWTPLVSFSRRAVASEMQVVRTKIHLWLMQDFGGGEAERDFLPPTSLQKTALKRDLRIPRHSFQKKKN